MVVTVCIVGVTCVELSQVAECVLAVQVVLTGCGERAVRRKPVIEPA